MEEGGAVKHDQGALGHAAHELLADARGRSLPVEHLVGAQGYHFVDLIRQQGEFVALAAEDDHPGLAGPAGASHPVEPVKVDNGEDLAAEVDDADEEVWRPGNWCQFDQRHDLVDVAQLDRVVFVGQREGHDIEHQRGGGRLDGDARQRAGSLLQHGPGVLGGRTWLLADQGRGPCEAFANRPPIRDRTSATAD